MTKECNLCLNKSVQTLINFGAHPVAHHFIEKPGNAEFVHPVELGFCELCGLTQLINPIPPNILYSNYNVLSSWKWNPHLPCLLSKIKKLLNYDKNAKILEVGSNDGALLAELRSDGYIKQIGLEPALDAVKVARKNGIETINAYFTEEESKKIVNNFGQCDLFISRQVLEHIENLDEYSRALRRVMCPGGLVVVEVPDFGFNQIAPDYSAIWEEHVNHFTEDTIVRFLNDSGVEVLEVEKAIFSGQILTAIGRFNGDKIISNGKKIHDMKKHAYSFRDRWPNFRSALHEYLAYEIKNGEKLALYGAGCRSTCLINYADISKYFAFAVDDQSEKIGKYMPGSHLGICPPAKLIKEGISLCFLAVNAENELKVIERNQEFKQQGGRFLSLHPPSNMLPNFWNKV